MIFYDNFAMKLHDFIGYESQPSNNKIVDNY